MVEVRCADQHNPFPRDDENRPLVSRVNEADGLIDRQHLLRK
jgi:hypothetical protein